MNTWWPKSVHGAAPQRLESSVKSQWSSWALIQYIKMSSYQCRKSHCGDKTVVRSSYLHIGISYTGKTTSLYWIRTLVPPHVGLSTDSRLKIVKSHHSYLAQNNSSIDTFFICGTFWSYFVFICNSKPTLSLEFRLDAEQMSQVDILFLGKSQGKYCSSLQHCIKQDWNVVTSWPGT